MNGEFVRPEGPRPETGEPEKPRDVIVIGGGAAGCFAAYWAAREGAAVTLLEKNEKLGKKIYITGKGRCNVTTACAEEEFLSKVLRNPRFLYASFSRFSNRDMIRWLGEQGLALKTERGERVFPASDKASDVTRTLQEAMRKAGVRLRLGCRAERLILEDGRVRGVEISTDKNAGSSPGKAAAATETLQADAVIVATGGVSYPSTGSTGDGYRFAREAGHNVTDPRPALVPLDAAFPGSVAFPNGRPIRDLAGLSLKNVGLRIRQGRKDLYEGFGEALFTHFGVSGPLVLSASGKIGDALEAPEKGPVVLDLDLKAALSEETLQQRFEREREALNPASQLSTLLGGWMPRALVPYVLDQAGLSPEEKLRSVTPKERGALIAAVKGLRIEVRGLRGFDEAIITRGGVAPREIDPATMASKKVEGLYFAGEVLDVDAATGGYNLQIAWTTGAAAGRAAARNTKKGTLQKETA